MYRDQNQRDFARTLRNQPTTPERRLWHLIRGEQLHGYKFRRQAAIGPYVVDFVCFSVKVIVELDGPQHLEPAAIEHYERRSNWLAARGFRTIRFRNQELDENIHGVVDAIESAVVEAEARAGITPPLTPPQSRGREQTEERN